MIDYLLTEQAVESGLEPRHWTGEPIDLETANAYRLAVALKQRDMEIYGG